jgi:predicted anti-sigma-YlaC factor YlaD
MLNCQEVTAKASQQIDGELGFRDRVAVRVHLLMCAKCRLFFKQFKALVRNLPGGTRSEPETPSSEFVMRVMTDIDAVRDASPEHSQSKKPQ